jgi:hypothetical protein
MPDQPKHTPGPWAWRLNPKSKSILLESSSWVVMSFERWGMRGATPMFADETPRNLKRAVDFGMVIPGREHHKHWALDLEHPDALLIAVAPSYFEAVEQMLAYEDAGGDGWWKGWEVLKAAHARATAQPQPLRDDERAEVLKSASSA